MGGQNRSSVRRELGLKAASTQPIALLTTQLTGGKARFMQFARLAVHIEPGLAPVVESYEGLTHWKRALTPRLSPRPRDCLHLRKPCAGATRSSGDGTEEEFSSGD